MVSICRDTTARIRVRVSTNQLIGPAALAKLMISRGRPQTLGGGKIFCVSTPLSLTALDEQRLCQYKCPCSAGVVKINGLKSRLILKCASVGAMCARMSAA